MRRNPKPTWKSQDHRDSTGFSAALQAANNYGSKLASWAKNIGSSVLSGLGNAVKDALSGEWKGIKSYFSHFFISEKIGVSKPAKEFFDYDNESPDTTRQLLEALTKIDKETLVHLTAIILALSKK